MSEKQFIILLFLLALSTFGTRTMPFIIFRNSEKIPPIIDYLGKVLPAAMMGLLVVYCFKDYNFGNMMAAAPALIASAGTIIIHLWKRNTILSISVGTILYMILIRVL